MLSAKLPMLSGHFSLPAHPTCLCFACDGDWTQELAASGSDSRGSPRSGAGRSCGESGEPVGFRIGTRFCFIRPFRDLLHLSGQNTKIVIKTIRENSVVTGSVDAIVLWNSV